MKYQCVACNAELTGTTPSCPYCFGKLIIVNEMTDQEQDDKEFEEWWNSDDAKSLHRRCDKSHGRYIFLISRKILREREAREK